MTNLSSPRVFPDANVPFWIQWRLTLGSRWPELRQWVELLSLAGVAGLTFDWLHVPVSWMLGPLFLGILYAVLQGPQSLPPTFITWGKAIVGVATAARFSPETLSLAHTFALPLLLCLLITGSLSMINGFLLWRWARIDRATSFLGSIPGAAAGIVAMSEEMGADAIAVAVLQYLRVVLVVLVVPTTVHILFPVETLPPVAALTPAVQTPSLPMSLNLAVLWGCCWFGMGGGRRLNLPASSFLGTFLVGLIALWALPQSFYVPQPLFSAALLLVGLSIGLKFDWATTRKLLKAVLIEVGLVLGLILSCLGIGYLFHLITQVDTITAVLGTTPGGLEAMIATVVQLGGDMGLVVTMQMTRMLTILLVGPGLVAAFTKHEQGKPTRSQKPSPEPTNVASPQ